MEKKIESYLHLYLGCEMMYATHHEPQDAKYKLTAENLKDAIDFGDLPYLRKLPTMTEEEDREFRNANNGLWIDEHWRAEGTRWLLSKGFDLFQLIESDLAIDRDKIKVEE
jgi:hypothetical protein